MVALLPTFLLQIWKRLSCPFHCLISVKVSITLCVILCLSVSVGNLVSGGNPSHKARGPEPEICPKIHAITVLDRANYFNFKCNKVPPLTLIKPQHACSEKDSFIIFVVLFY